MEKKKNDLIIVATNRKALHNYQIESTVEAGISLEGPEVKSLRLKQASLEGSFARVNEGEVLLYNMHISPYAFNHVNPLDPLRTRKLLLKKTEIRKLFGTSSVGGSALVPLEVYFRNGWAKIKLAVTKGKKSADKRDDIKKKDLEREMRREFKGQFKA